MGVIRIRCIVLLTVNLNTKYEVAAPWEGPKS